MPTVCDVSADLPQLENLGAERGLTAEEAVTLAEELVAYHRHFAPLFCHDASSPFAWRLACLWYNHPRTEAIGFCSPLGVIVA